MSNRELLERAAKAAGYVVKGEVVDCSDVFTHLLVNQGHGTRRFRWNPLTDDGDALRLAVKLGLKLNVCVTSGATQVGGIGTFVEIDFDADPYAATRRAIVRAAAAMYKD